MFSQNHREPGAVSGAETLIGPSVKLEGNFNSDGDIVVEGILTGNLTTRGDVRVGGQAVIEAQVVAKSAAVAGKVKGNITVEGSLHLSSTAVIAGDVRAGSLAIEEGAVLNGKVTMSNKEKSARSGNGMSDRVKHVEPTSDSESL